MARAATTTQVAQVDALRDHHIPAVRRAVAAQLAPVRSLHPLAMATRLRADRDDWVAFVGRLYGSVGQPFADHTAATLATRLGTTPSKLVSATGYSAAYQAFMDSYAGQTIPPYVDQIAASLDSHISALPDPNAATDALIDDIFAGVELVLSTMITLTASNLAPLAGANAASQSSGTDLTKMWQALEDARTRPTHSAADGQVQELSDPFDVGDSQLLFPCDQSLGADIGEIIYCRCVVVYDVAAQKRRLYRLDWPERWADIVLKAFNPDQPRDGHGRKAPGDGSDESSGQSFSDASAKMSSLYGSESGARAEAVAHIAADMQGNKAFNAYMDAKYHGLATPEDANREIDNALGTWAESSGDGNQTSCMLQAAAEKEFGVDDAYTETLSVLPREEDAAQVDAYAAILRSEYNYTQQKLAENDITEVPVVRGMHWNSSDSDLYLKGPSDAEWDGQPHTANVQLQALSSFSSDMRQGTRFADFGSGYDGMLVGGMVPASHVIGTGFTGLGTSHESEVVVIGGKRSMHYVAWKGRTIDAPSTKPADIAGTFTGALQSKRASLLIQPDKDFADWLKTDKHVKRLEWDEQRARLVLR